MAVTNHSTTDRVWTDGTYTYTELIRQEYGGNNCVFSAGTIEGHPIDTVYLRLEKDGTEPTWWMLRPDELAVINWLCAGVLYSLHLEDVLAKEPTTDNP